MSSSGIDSGCKAVSPYLNRKIRTVEEITAASARAASLSSRPVALENAPRVLIVEDDHFVSDALQAALREAGFRVSAAEDGYRALWGEAALEADLLLTDNDMPRLSGVELIGVLRGKRPDLPVVLITGRPLPEPWMTGRGAPGTGPLKVLFKPFHFRDLMAAVTDALASRPRKEGVGADLGDRQGNVHNL